MSGCQRRREIYGEEPGFEGVFFRAGIGVERRINISVECKRLNQNEETEMEMNE